MDETPLDVVAGDTFSYTWTFENIDGTVATGIATSTTYFAIKNKEDDEDVDALLLKTYPCTDPTTGVVIVYATPGEMTIPEGIYSYVMKIKIGSDVYTFMYGTMKIRAKRVGT